MADEANSENNDKGNLRQQIEAAIEQQQKKADEEFWQKRIEIARRGLEHAQKEEFGEAVKAYFLYLRTLQKQKELEKDEKIRPDHFPEEKDQHEIFLISGIYWDLTKIYDQAQSEKAEGFFRQFLNQFVTFSKGQRFETLAAETIRKHLVGNRAKHRKALRQAYQKLGGNRCFIASSLIEYVDPALIDDIRYYRDQYWKQSSQGRWVIKKYYQYGPHGSNLLNHSPEIFRSICGYAVSMLLKVIQGWYRFSKDGKQSHQKDQF